jgi:MinD superfamily P-loop ATPase
MRVAIASGKGGTGKTTLATSLAYVATARGNRVAYLDCDVEEPNGHLFLKPRIREQRPIEKLVPAVDVDRCTHCGRCAASCRFGAIVCVGQQTLIFSELCHSCGGCVMACPEEAIAEMGQPIGQLRIGGRGSLEFVDGVLNVGEAMSPPAIRAVKDAAPDSPLTILDCPPGTSCPVIESVRGCDLLVLVTEPTPFGMHDLQLAVELARALRLNFGVVINRADAGDRAVWDYCRRQRIPILAEIADDRAVAEAYSQGQVAAELVPHVAQCAERLLATIESGVLM